LFDPARHVPLADVDWDKARARDAIAAICRDAEAGFDPERWWPVHPADWEPGTPERPGGLYLGAAGMVHALRRLREFHDVELEVALDPALGDEEDAGDGLLAGAAGVLVVLGSPALADAIARNAANPSNELLQGAPGTMLAARAAGREDLWRDSARILLSRQDADGLWTQELYGDVTRYLGAGHGFAGNVHALLQAREWLDEAGAVEARAHATATAFAVREDGLANWPPRPGDPLDRVQWCHGAPGFIVAGAADEELLREAGELVWRAGPLRNAGLCHGTAGNGFALLALHARTGDERWLARARAFAMHALGQVEGGRFGLFTGDVGAALLAAACITGDARFPGLDDLDMVAR
jgi:hypothetical protein